jgi:hypothetical protein
MHGLPMRRFVLAVLMLAPLCAQAKTPLTGIGQFEIPPWFKVSFLDLRQDIAEATVQGKRLAVFFHQDGSSTTTSARSISPIIPETTLISWKSTCGVTAKSPI